MFSPPARTRVFCVFVVLFAIFVAAAVRLAPMAEAREVPGIGIDALKFGSVTEAKPRAPRLEPERAKLTKIFGWQPIRASIPGIDEQENRNDINATLTTSPEARATGPHIYLGESRKLVVDYVGEADAKESLAAGDARPLSMTSGDLDGDGVDDLLVGYGTSQGIIALYRGNLDAFAPQSKESFDAIGRGDFPSPFLPKATAITVPVRPDFVAEGVYNPYGYRDLVVAARGGSSIYLLSNDGKGNFSTPRAIDVGGAITALAVGEFGKSGPFSKLLVGVCDEKGSSLHVYEGAVNSLGDRNTHPLNGPATNLVLDELGGGRHDAFFVSNGKVGILHSSPMRLEKVSLPASVNAFALGSFIYDRN